MRNLDVKAHGHNNDGIDFEMSRNFLVEDCSFDQGDDAVVIKAGRNQDAWRLNTPCENIVIRNCQILKGHTYLVSEVKYREEYGIFICMTALLRIL